LLLAGLIMLPASPFQLMQDLTPPPTPHVFEVGLSEYEKGWSSGIATAYYNGKDEMNGLLGITSSGYDLDEGSMYQGYHILATDDKFPFYTKIDIKVNGEILHGIVLDRGGRIRGNRFDIVHRTKKESFQFGKQDITWKVVD
jgi:3D (Asp-Asp-Asp) domain-containing protein